MINKKFKVIVTQEFDDTFNTKVRGYASIKAILTSFVALLDTIYTINKDYKKDTKTEPLDVETLCDFIRDSYKMIEKKKEK